MGNNSILREFATAGVKFAQSHVPESAAGRIVLVFLLLLSALVFRGVYNVCFHPLRNIPGPFFARVSHFWMLKQLYHGNLAHVLVELHKKHGSVVRIAPNELSYTSMQAWHDIFGIKIDPEFQKDRRFLDDGFKDGDNIVVMRTADHRVLRRQLAHGFSEKALREQEGIVKSYIQDLFDRLHEQAEKGKFDIVQWFNFFTFDVIGDLCYGEPYNCLRDGKVHPWIAMIFENIQFVPYGRFLNSYPWIKFMVEFVVPKKIRDARTEHVNLTKAKMDRRMASTVERTDFLHNIFKTGKLPRINDLYATGGALIIAGSETTATALSGCTYLLCKNPRVMEKCKAEVRAAFASASDISMVSAGQLKYLNACIEEALRVYPPQPLSNGRIVPSQGKMIDGRWIPGGITVGVSHFPAYHNSEIFHRCDEYIPERWLGDERFAGDLKGIFNPFSFGPRNCIGKNLAYSELRCVLARLLLEFDVALAPESDGWIAQKSMGVWLKPPLFVTLTGCQNGSATKSCSIDIPRSDQ